MIRTMIKRLKQILFWRRVHQEIRGIDRGDDRQWEDVAMKKILLASMLAIASIPGAHTAEQDFVTAKTEGAKTLKDHIAYCEGTYGDYHGEVPTKAEAKEKVAEINRCIAEAKAELRRRKRKNHK
jgi:hypothetical protein